MKARYSPPLTAALMAVFMGAFAGAPAYSAATQSDSNPSAHTPEKQSPTAEPSTGMQSPTSQSKVCARLDTNHDGEISAKEFKASGKPQSLFKQADATHRGWLKADECARALKG
jgi:hypothetical protein